MWLSLLVGTLCLLELSLPLQVLGASSVPTASAEHPPEGEATSGAAELLAGAEQGYGTGCYLHGAHRGLMRLAAYQTSSACACCLALPPVMCMKAVLPSSM